MKTVFVYKKPGYAMARMTVAITQMKLIAKITHAMRTSSLARTGTASPVTTYAMETETARTTLMKTRCSAERLWRLCVPLGRLAAATGPVFRGVKSAMGMRIA